MPEIIDLTLPSSPIEILSEGEIPVSESLNNETSSSQKKTRKSRKRKKSKGLTRDGVDSSRNQSLERHNSRDSPVGTVSRRRSASPKRRSPSQGVSDQELFFFDAAPAPVVEPIEPTQISITQIEGSKTATDRLLLPSHVSVLSVGEERAVPVEIIHPSPVDSEGEDYIEYLDYDDKKAGLVRYFEMEAEEAAQAKPIRFVCKNCGAEGAHKTYDCPVQVCLTCGARDEHSTRSCPISKTCYTCGMKGHINKTCPNRFSRSRLMGDTDDDCERCGSQKHKMNECPTLWRIYQYVNDEDHVVIIQTREEMKTSTLGNGGEGYIASEEWCYNCGNPGHLGDECDEVAHIYDIPSEPSAFSLHNIMSGPFYDPASDPVRVRRGPRELQNEEDRPKLQDDWGMDAPLHVGKQGKNKDKERLARRYRDQEADDTEDWFNNPRNMRNRGNDKPIPNGPKAMKFSTSMKDVGRHFDPPPSASPRKNGPPSLLDRLGDNPHRDNRRRTGDQYGRSGDQYGRSGDQYGRSGEHDSYHIRGASKHSGDRDGKYPRSSSGRDRERQRRDSRDWERDRGHGQGNGPRYKGGYNR